MRKMEYVGKKEISGDKEREFIEVIKTKCGNRYIVLRNETEQINIPMHELDSFCLQFPSSPIITKEEMDRRVKALKDFVEECKNI